MLPPQTAAIARATVSEWEADGLRLLELRATAEQAQLLFSVTPGISPVVFCQRVKGRLQHAFRDLGTPVDFSRKVSFRSMGENTSDVVRNYILGQVGKEDFADPRFRTIMRQFTKICTDVHLDQPSESDSGRYWYNLHVVLVLAHRFRITTPDKLGSMRDTVLTLAPEHGHRIAAVSVMPDHVHIALRGNIKQAPEQIALMLQNDLARAVGCRPWQDSYYVGTFSEYDMDEIRHMDKKEEMP